jgi:cytochrome c oxidase cbb3-type subunit III
MIRAFRAVFALALLAAADVVPAADEVVARGAVLFATHCVQCHGAGGRGDGKLAARFNPRPSDLVASRRPEEYKMQIVILGGAALGRSDVMPEWGLELSGQEIYAVVQYLQVLALPESAGRPGG